MAASSSYLTYLHTDHLGTPRLGTDTDGNVAWRWRSDAFGSGADDPDPDGDGELVSFDLRFPGQYFDAESGLHYNYFRYYDPATGRYTRSDPIGLDGGLNSYLYAGSNPLTWIDPFGLNGARPRGRGTRSPMTLEQAIASARVPQLLEQICRFDPEFQYATIAPRNWRYGRQDVQTLEAILRQYETSCVAEPRITYGSTPAGRQFSRHYGAETGPVRNMPGSVIDAVMNGAVPRPGRNGTTVYYDPINNVTVVSGANGISSARKGPPGPGL